MKTIEKTVNDMRDMFNKTDVVALAKRLAELEATVLELQLRLENAENELQNHKAQYRNDQWSRAYIDLGVYPNFGK